MPPDHATDLLKRRVILGTEGERGRRGRGRRRQTGAEPRGQRSTGQAKEAEKGRERRAGNMWEQREGRVRERTEGGSSSFLHHLTWLLQVTDDDDSHC